MKKDINLKLVTGSIILFNIFFMIIFVFYNDIIIIPNSIFKYITKEYYIWFLNKPSVANEGTIIFITQISKIIFPILFLGQFIYVLFDEKYTKIIDKKKVLEYLIVGFIVWLIYSIFIKYRVEHYRLFMSVVPIEIFSLILLFVVLKIQRYSS